LNSMGLLVLFRKCGAAPLAPEQEYNRIR
jgi:hypothetical protein